LLERDAFDIVGDDVYLLGCVNQVMQLDNARMLQTFEHRDFSLRGLALHRVLQSILLVEFYRIFLLIALVEAETDCGIGTLAYDSTDVIRLKLPVRLGTS